MMCGLVRQCEARGGVRQGLSVVEMLVAIAVVSLLMALLLPAVQSSRESARRAACIEHLRQLGAACQAFESAHGTFPETSGVELGLVNGTVGYVSVSLSAHARLLPWLDEMTVFETIDHDHLGWDLPGEPPRSVKLSSPLEPTNEAPLNTTVPVYLCPSDRQVPHACNYRSNIGIYSAYPFGKEPPCNEDEWAAGAFVHGRGVPISDFRDGLSNTALFSERLIGDFDPDTFTPWTDTIFERGDVAGCTGRQTLQQCRLSYVPGRDHDSYSGATWLFGSYRQTWYNHLVPPNADDLDCGSAASIGGGQGMYAARSYHPGGVNVCFADGRATFVNDAIDVAVWKAVATRAGQESMSLQF